VTITNIPQSLRHITVEKTAGMDMV